MAKYPSLALSLAKLFDYGILQEIFPSLKDKDKSFIEKQTIYSDLFPPASPAILKVIDLFPDSSLEEKIELCRYLKLPNEDMDAVEKLHKINELTHKRKLQTDYNWAHALAFKNSDMLFGVIAAHLPLKEKKEFLEKIEQLKNQLQDYIERIKTKNPVLKAHHLMEKGITPSPAMGQLLKLGEEISINKKINDEQQIIHLLKTTPFWEKAHENNKKHN